MKHIFLLAAFITFTAAIPAQEALKSVEEDYYDFLSLQGLAERPALNYRTLSDAAWSVYGEEPHPWENLNLGSDFLLAGIIRARFYGPELFMSVNTAAPYGQNDGALWQGRGFNASISAGFRLEGWGVELTFRPQLSFSQNAAFEIMPSNSDSPYGYFWGYARNAGADAPQRFGDQPFFTWDWGDSEIRYTWKTLTIGFGTQAIWLGPSYLNSILHSNNAPAYPKFDIGLRRQRVTLPWLGWYIGDVEARLWVGYLSESDYFDNDDSNDHTMFHGLSLAYAPSFLPGLTLFANRVALVPWSWENLKYILPSRDNTIEDQKASFGVSWLFQNAGLEIYGELGVDDFAYMAGFTDYVRYPFHTMMYTAGLKKTIPVAPDLGMYGELFFEWNSMEMSQDFQLQWPYSPYFHHLITHGYTNRGQWLGAGSGWGGNSQYLEFRLYYPKGTSSVFINRNNPDNNFIYSKAVNASAAADNLNGQYFTSWKANFVFGLGTKYFVTKNLMLGGGFAYNLIVNPYYIYDEYIHNFSLQLGIKWIF